MSTASIAAPVDCFTPDDLAFFEQHGYVIARGLTGDELLREMRRVTAEGVARHIPPIEYEADLQYPGAPESRAETGGDTIRRLKEAFGRDPVFTQWVMLPGLRRRLQQLLGPDVVMPLAHHNCIMTKQPSFSSETHWHQDTRYWSFERGDLVNAWLALGSETAENGCLMVLPGTHRQTFSREQFDAALFLREDLPENQALIESRVLVELAPGDTLFFHARTFHAAGRNTTRDPKYSLVFTFRPADNRPRPGTRSASMPEVLLPAV